MDVSFYNVVNQNKNFFNEELLDNIIKRSNLLHDYYKVLRVRSHILEVENYKSYSEVIRSNFSDLVIIGIGGSVLNPSSLLDLANKNQNGIRIHILDNTDSYYFNNLFDKISLKNTAFLVISNSGFTTETLALYSAVINKFYENEISNLGKYFFVITNTDNNNRILKISNDIGANIIQHEKNISGRYSSFSNVNILPGLIAGLNMQDYLEGANEIIDGFLKKEPNHPSIKSANFFLTSSKSIMVNIFYIQRFKNILEWYSQIICESLGKETKGFSVINSQGPNFQHSSLQLYLDGPSDKTFSFIDCEINLQKVNLNTKHQNFLVSNLDEINSISLNTTLNSLIEKNLPVRKIVLDNFSEKEIGKLFAYFIIETVLIAELWKIDPFSQKSVECNKNKISKLSLNSDIN